MFIEQRVTFNKLIKYFQSERRNGATSAVSYRTHTKESAQFKTTGLYYKGSVACFRCKYINIF